MTAPTLLWFRQDLRLADHPALQAAIARGGPIVPVFLWAPGEDGAWAPGGASRWWLHESLGRLDAALRERGAALVLRRTDDSLAALRKLVTQTGATAVYWNRRYEPAAIARDRVIKEQLRAAGIEAHGFNAALLAEPWDVRNRSGRPFQVYTPFWKSLLAALDPPRPVAAPARFDAPRTAPHPDTLADLGLLPPIRWYDRMATQWTPGESGAARRLASFIDIALAHYADDRDRPDRVGTSRLSPHLHFGEISPRQVWHALADAAAARGLDTASWRSGKFIAEVGWREFAHHLLFHFPNTPLEPLRGEFTKFQWADEPAQLEAWQRGRTGIPLVDAGMRELWAHGWMHNRVRMIVASFLVKNLRLPWQHGARWFWDTLVDADLASNTLGWQWSAGCGADAAPYFRVFNPVTQGRKFDPDGHYVRRWIPELAALDGQQIHAPWECDAATLHRAGVALGVTYPRPIVDLKNSRAAALAAFAQLRGR
jgi:deoxyribodipyrimidine photo-lyase